MDANEKARFNAEALALRSIYYFELLRMFGNIPLMLKPILSSQDNLIMYHRKTLKRFINRLKPTY